jgi:hypothetical protein
MDPKAWEAGRQAGQAGQRARCPNPVGTIAAWNWNAGYIEGKATRDPALRPHPAPVAPRRH